MKMFRRWRYPFFEFCLRFWNLAAAIFLVLRISATRKGASYPPTKRVYSLIEFLLDSAKRQNYAVCMCVCRFYIYLPPLSSLSYIHKPTNSDLYYHKIHLYSRDSVNLSDPPWKIAYFNHLRTCLTAILRCNPYTPLYLFTMITESLCPCQCLDSLEFLRDSGLFSPLCLAGRWHRLPWSLPHGIPTGHIYTGALSYTLQGQAFFRLPIPAFQRALTSRPVFWYRQYVQ